MNPVLIIPFQTCLGKKYNGMGKAGEVKCLLFKKMFDRVKIDFEGHSSNTSQFLALPCHIVTFLMLLKCNSNCIYWLLKYNSVLKKEIFLYKSEFKKSNKFLWHYGVPPPPPFWGGSFIIWMGHHNFTNLKDKFNKENLLFQMINTFWTRIWQDWWNTNKTFDHKE